jgi:hypothetical protein
MYINDTGTSVPDDRRYDHSSEANLHPDVIGIGVGLVYAARERAKHTRRLNQHPEMIGIRTSLLEKLHQDGGDK